MTHARVRAWVGLGGNLDRPGRRIRAALDELGRIPHTRLEAASSLYRNPPMGPVDQPDFINAVARIGTALSAFDLLDALQAIETAHGRRRTGRRWGARTLDLDLLLYGTHSIHRDRLRVPHAGLPERAFVLYPLAEIDPALVVPLQGPLASLLERVPRGRLEPVHADEDEG